MKNIAFIVNDNQIVEKEIDFFYYAGFALVQKQKSIASMHDKIKEQVKGEILEISTKSPSILGQNLSAFNLKVKYHGKMVSIENVFQSSKVFEHGGPYLDLLEVSPSQAKKDSRLRESGKLIKFRLENKEYKLEPKTLFYDWIYCRTLFDNKDLIKELVHFNIFTDIEFNSKKSINCQARSAAFFVWLFLNDYLIESLKDFNKFEYYNKKAILYK